MFEGYTQTQHTHIVLRNDKVLMITMYVSFWSIYNDVIVVGNGVEAISV